MSNLNLTVQRHQAHDKVLTMQAGGGAPGGGAGIQLQPVARQFAAPPPAQPPPARALAPPPSAPVDERELLHTMHELANPVKKAASPGAAAFGDDFGEEEEEDEQEGGEEEDEEEGGGGGEAEYGEYEEEEEEDGFEAPPAAAPYVERPSEGFRSLDEEKSDIIFKLQRLSRQGHKGLRAFTPYSDIRDMRNELSRVKTELELDRSVKFQRKILMAIVSALEWGNGKFNPFDLELDGWSEQMHQSVQTSTEYDGVFEELFFKYRGKVSTPPEIRLMLMVGGSAMMFHMTKAMMKSALPGIGDLMRQNPAMVESLVKSFVAPGAGAAAEQASAAQQAAAAAAAQQAPQEGRREMRGPGIDLAGLGGLGNLGGAGGLGGLGGLFGGMQPGAGGVPPPPVPPAGLQPATTRADRVKPAAAPSAPFVDDDASERLSDVISEDLQSLPDDLSAGGGSRDSSPAGRKHITVPPRGRAAKRARRAATTGTGGQKVITI